MKIIRAFFSGSGKDHSLLGRLVLSDFIHFFFASHDMNLGEVERIRFFGLELYGSWPSVATIKTVHNVVDVHLDAEWGGGGRMSEGYY